MDYEQEENEQDVLDSLAGDGAAQVLKAYQTLEEQKHWVAELDAAKADLKNFHKSGAETVERYVGERKTEEEIRYNVFFSNAEIKMANYFSQAPEPDVKRTFNDPADDIGRVGSLAIERNLIQEIKREGFLEKFQAAVRDRTIPGMGVIWQTFDEEKKTATVQKQVQDPVTGQMISVEVEEEKVTQCVPSEYVPWDDFLYPSSPSWFVVPWVGKRTPMTKKDMLAKFDNDQAATMINSFTFEAEKDKKRSPTSKNRPVARNQKTMDVYEIWDKEKKLVWWICESASYPLDVKKDTMEYPDFFPTPLPPLGRFHPSKTEPVSDYSLIRGLYNQLDDLEKKISGRLRAIQTKFVYDSGNTDLATLLQETNDLEGIPVKDWAAQQLERGGTKNAFEFLPITDLVGSYRELVSARESVKQQIYEIESLPDLMRGQSQAYDSSVTTQLKASFGTTRTEAVKREIARYIEKVMQLKAHLICRFVSAEQIVKRMGVLPETDQQFIGPMMQIVKSEGIEGFNLTVSVDSIQAKNWASDQQEMTQAVVAISQLMGQAGASASDPSTMEFIARTAQALVSRFRNVESLESYLDDFIAKKRQEVAAKANEPPKPSPAEMQQQALQAQTQADVQIAAMKEETKRAIAAEKSQREADNDAWERRFKAIELQLKDKKIETEAKTAAAEVSVEASRAAHENARDLAELYSGTN